MKKPPALASRAVLAALSAAALAAAAAWSALAPCGGWTDAVFRGTFWNHSDPAGYYLPSAHELYSSRGRLLYPGHPGLPMQVLLRAVQDLRFLLRRAPGEGFSAFVARDLVGVFFWSKLALAAAHALSFWLVFAFARRLLRAERAALLAAAAYATCLPVVYYLARVSVEPIMIGLLAASFLLVWETEDALAAGGARPPALAAAAGAAAVAGLATKFHLLWPLPAVCGLHLLWGDAWPLARVPAPGRARVRALLAYALGAAAALALCSLLLDWRDFFAYWDVSGMGAAPPLAAAAGLARRQAEVAGAAVLSLRRVPLRDWLPGPTRSGLYWMCEGPLLAAAAWGAARERRRAGFPAGRWFWVAAAGSYTVLIWAYRSFAVAGDFHGFHYLFVATLLACVLAGAAGDAALERLGSGRARLAAAACGLAVLHAAALAAAADAAAHDAAQYARLRAFGDALAVLEPGRRIAIVGERPPGAPALFGIGVLRGAPPPRSALVDAVDAEFVYVAGGALPADVAAVVEIAGAPRRRAAYGPYDPRAWPGRRPLGQK